MVNKCVLDSILWFHLECPKRAGEFDDPVEFKRKWRDYFALNKSVKEKFDPSKKTPAEIRLDKMYGFTSGYPEDIKEVKSVKKFMEEF